MSQRFGPELSTMRTIIAIVVFLSLALVVVTADSQPVQSDSDFRQKLVGTWVHEVGRTNWISWRRSTEIYSSNGFFAEEGRTISHGTTKLSVGGGMWQINNGILMLTVTNDVVSGSDLAVVVRQGSNYIVKHQSGYTNFSLLEPGIFGTNYHKLIRIDDHEMVYHMFTRPLDITNLPYSVTITDVVTNRRIESVVGATKSEEASTNDWNPDTTILDEAAKYQDPVDRDAASTLAHDVKRFYELLRNKKWHQTYELRAKAFREDMPESDYLAEAIKNENRWCLVDYAVLSAQLENAYPSTNLDQAVLICKFTELPDHAVSYTTVYWHKEEGVWKCLSAGPSKLGIFRGLRPPVVDWR